MYMYQHHCQDLNLLSEDPLIGRVKVLVHVYKYGCREANYGYNHEDYKNVFLPSGLELNRGHDHIALDLGSPSKVLVYKRL